VPVVAPAIPATPVPPITPSGNIRYASVAELPDSDIFYLTYPIESKDDEYVSRTLSGPGGRVARASMPLTLYIRNTGGSDGAGLCVFTSIYHTGVYQGLWLQDFRKWMERRPGGGWPEKVDRMLKQYCQEKNVSLPDYIHITGLKQMDLVEKAIASGRMVCITWGTDYSHYNGQTIAHMVNCVHLDKEWGAIVDNNFPREILWVKRPIFDSYAAWTGRRGSDGFWGIIFTDGAMPVIKE